MGTTVKGAFTSIRRDLTLLGLTTDGCVSGAGAGCVTTTAGSGSTSTAGFFCMAFLPAAGALADIYGLTEGSITGFFASVIAVLKPSVRAGAWGNKRLA